MNRKQKMKVALDSLFTTSKPIAVMAAAVPQGNNGEPQNGKPAAAEVDHPKPDVTPVAVLEAAQEAPIETIPSNLPETRPELGVENLAPAKPAGSPAAAVPSAAAKTQENEARAGELDRHLVVFRLCDEQYGVDISAVDGIIKMQAITIVPHTPFYIQGVTNLRGTVLPVFDLRKRFGLEARALTKDARIIVIRKHGSTVGMIVDSVTEVLRVPQSACEPTPEIVSTIDSSYLNGIARTEDQLVILLDLDRILHGQGKASTK